MRSIEFILKEAISLTYLTPFFKESILDEIKGGVAQMYFKLNQVDPVIKSKVNTEITIPTKIARTYLTEQLNTLIALGISEVIAQKLNIKTNVVILPLANQAQVSGLNIEISESLIKPIVDSILTEVYNDTVSHLTRNSELFSTYAKSFKNVSSYVHKIDNVVKHVSQLIVTLVHEITHIVQHNTQYSAGRSSTEYRSYLEKDKTKFHNAVRNLSSGNSEDSDYRLYHASPQEIAAFAQETALRFIQDVVDNTDPASITPLLPSLIKQYVDHRFNNPANAREYSVFKRFHKLLYQEIIRYIESTSPNKISNN